MLVGFVRHTTAPLIVRRLQLQAFILHICLEARIQNRVFDAVMVLALHALHLSKSIRRRWPLSRLVSLSQAGHLTKRRAVVAHWQAERQVLDRWRVLQMAMVPTLATRGFEDRARVTGSFNQQKHSKPKQQGNRGSLDFRRRQRLVFFVVSMTTSDREQLEPNVAQ